MNHKGLGPNSFMTIWPKPLVLILSSIFLRKDLILFRFSR